MAKDPLAIKLDPNGPPPEFMEQLFLTDKRLQKLMQSRDGVLAESNAAKEESREHMQHIRSEIKSKEKEISVLKMQINNLKSQESSAMWHASKQCKSSREVNLNRMIRERKREIQMTALAKYQDAQRQEFYREMVKKHGIVVPVQAKKNLGKRIDYNEAERKRIADAFRAAKPELIQQLPEPGQQQPKEPSNDNQSNSSTPPKAGEILLPQSPVEDERSQTNQHQVPDGDGSNRNGESIEGLRDGTSGSS